MRKRRRIPLRWRLAFWAAFIVAALFFYQCYVRRSPGSGAAGPPVPRAEFERVWTERQAALLGLGDSITAGYGASAGKSYFGRLLKNSDDESPDLRGICLSAVIPNITADNRAVSGSTSLDHLERQVKKLAPHPPDVLGIVVMTTGGNDLIHDYGRSPPTEGAMYGATLEQARPWIANYEKRLGLMFDMISAAFPGGCEIFVANIYDPTDGVGTAHIVFLPSWPDGLKILAEYNAAIARAVERRKNVHLVNLHSLFMGHGITCAQFWRKTYRSGDPHYWYGEVFEDPNDRGYDAIRRAFLLKMVEVPAWKSSTLSSTPPPAVSRP